MGQERVETVTVSFMTATVIHQKKRYQIFRDGTTCRGGGGVFVSGDFGTTLLSGGSKGPLDP